MAPSRAAAAAAATLRIPTSGGPARRAAAAAFPLRTPASAAYASLSRAASSLARTAPLVPRLRSVAPPRRFFSCALRARAAAAPDAADAADAVALEAPEHLDDAERHVFNKLNEQLAPVRLEDISGGCGSMYGLDIVSKRFEGLTVVKQHKLVNQVLAEEIKGWHGVQLKTKAP